MSQPPDKQLVALHGEPDGSVLLIDWRMPPGLNHRYVRPAGDYSPITVELGDIDASTGQWQDALKLSRISGVTVLAGAVTGGSEDVVDCCWCRDVACHIGRAVPRGRYVSTTKGGTVGYQLTIGEQVGHGRETDHDLGNWYDYNRERTKGVTITVQAGPVGPNRCRVLHAAVPALVGGNWKTSDWSRWPVNLVQGWLKALRLA